MLCAIVIRATRTFGIAGDCTVVVREDAFGGRLADREKSWHGVGAGAGEEENLCSPVETQLKCCQSGAFFICTSGWGGKEGPRSGGGSGQ